MCVCVQGSEQSRTSSLSLSSPLRCRQTDGRSTTIPSSLLKIAFSFQHENCSSVLVALACLGLDWSQQVKVLNDGGEFPSNAEVVVAPPSLFAQTVKDAIRSDIKASKARPKAKHPLM